MRSEAPGSSGVPVPGTLLSYCGPGVSGADGRVCTRTQWLHTWNALSQPGMVHAVHAMLVMAPRWGWSGWARSQVRIDSTMGRRHRMYVGTAARCSAWYTIALLLGATVC